MTVRERLLGVLGLLRRRRLPVLAVLLALACCAGCLAWYLVADGNPDLAFGTARDAALAQGRTDVATLSSVDATHPATAMAGWLTVTTGTLRDQLSSETGADEHAVTQAGTSTQAQVTDAALTALDTRAGTATLIATVQIQVTHQGSSVGTQRKRLEATLASTASGWKITSLTAVA